MAIHRTFLILQKNCPWAILEAHISSKKNESYFMATETRHRAEWLDLANVVAMACVVWFHIPSAVEVPVRHIEYITVNAMFFILSGCSFGLALQRRSSFRARLSHICRRLLWPTTVMYAVCYVLWLAIGKKLGGDVAEWYEPLVQFVTGRFSLVLATYWFIVCLIGMQILCFCLHRMVRSRSALALVCGLLPLLTLIFGDIDCYCIPEVLVFFPFFAIGTITSPADDAHGHRMHHLAWLLAGWCIYFGITHMMHLPTVYTPMEAVCGTGACLVAGTGAELFCRKRHAGRMVTTLRYGALVLLASQNYIIGLCRVVLDRVTQEQDFLARHSALKPAVLILVYAVSIPAIQYIRHFCPQILGRSKAKKEEPKFADHG